MRRHAVARAYRLLRRHWDFTLIAVIVAVVAVHPLVTRAQVSLAIRAAVVPAEADFAYLMQTAKLESRLNPKARAKTSSATGLYQFIDETWLELVGRHGGKLGYDHYAQAIRAGTLTPPLRARILALRTDPKVAAHMAAAYAVQNRQTLEMALGRPVDEVEQYFAHFLGPTGAVRFFRALRATPGAPAAKLFPAAARANRSVFYNGGRPYSLEDVHARIRGRFTGEVI